MLLGMSHRWWVDKHKWHHGNLEPEIKVGMISYSTLQAIPKRWIRRPF